MRARYLVFDRGEALGRRTINSQALFIAIRRPIWIASGCVAVILKAHLASEDFTFHVLPFVDTITVLFDTADRLFVR